jgi:hypothetical protein
VSNGGDFVKDVDDLKEVLGVVAEKIPDLLRGLRDILYSPEAAESMAGAVATFYKKLVEAGIPSDEAMTMAKGYMINLREMMGGKGISIGNIMGRRREED